MLSKKYGEQDLRKWQIDTLKIFNDHVIVLNENTEYRVEFSAGGKNMSLNIVLGPDFPNEKPAIFVTPAIPHPWVQENTNQVVNAPGLLNYSIHSDLGRVVQAITREFQKTVPNMSSVEEKHVEVPVQTNSSLNMMFPELQELTIEELQEIYHNTDLQDKLLENCPQLVELDLETEEIMSNIENIAQDNLNKQELLENMKSEVIDRISTIVQMKIGYEEMNMKHQKLTEKYDPRNIREALKGRALEADEEAESIAEQFLLGNIPVETFINQFAEKRALGQARRAREERLAHQLAQLDMATS